jgi:hypothetical protein
MLFHRGLRSATMVLKTGVERQPTFLSGVTVRFSFSVPAALVLPIVVIGSWSSGGDSVVFSMSLRGLRSRSCGSLPIGGRP